MISRPHGFVWPEGLPPCGMCGSPASDMIHVTPGTIDPVLMPISAAVRNITGEPRRSHAYVMPGGTTAGVVCVECNQPIKSSYHPVGMASGVRMLARDVSTKERKDLAGQGKALPDGSYPIANAQDLRNAIQAIGRAKDPAKAKAHIKRRAKALGLENLIPDSWSRQSAFVAEIGDRLVFASRGDTATMLSPQIERLFREKSAADSANMWVVGRYVEADAPNRNAAYWSTEDLEIGQPSVAHGPINWLHEERHIIGAIAGSELVYAQRESADEDSIGNHIVAVGAVWPYVYPSEARIIADASGMGNLWFSMECVSRAVACLADDCTHEMSYTDYMRQKASRCGHMRDGAPRRFIDPIFEGAGIIVPPVRPGWAKADARVLMPQAAALAERQAAAFDGMSTSDAETLVAQLISAAENPA